MLTVPDTNKLALFVVNGKETREVPFVLEEPVSFTTVPKGVECVVVLPRTGREARAAPAIAV